MKVDLGDITNPNTGEIKEVIAKTTTGVKPRDLLIGCGFILFGVAWISRMAFKHGAESGMKAEYDTLEDLGLFKNDIF